MPIDFRTRGYLYIVMPTTNISWCKSTIKIKMKNHCQHFLSWTLVIERL